MRAIAGAILRFHRELSRDPHHRYRSWGHCYRYFRRRAALHRSGDLDGGALRLGFYLASWGMYRGSSFLLQKGFRVHRPVVREVLRPRYDWLLAFRPRSAAGEGGAAAQQIAALAEAVRGAYRDRVASANGRRRAAEATDTLTSKVLLATLGCAPAFDLYVVRGLRAEGLSYSALNARTLTAVFDWYGEHRAAFEAVGDRIRENGLRYPP